MLRYIYSENEKLALEILFTFVRVSSCRVCLIARALMPLVGAQRSHIFYSIFNPALLRFGNILTFVLLEYSFRFDCQLLLTIAIDTNHSFICFLMKINIIVMPFIYKGRDGTVSEALFFDSRLDYPGIC